MDKNNDCLKKVVKPQNYVFELDGTDIQFCLHVGMEWEDCFLLIKNGQDVKELRPDDSNDLAGTMPKSLFCPLLIKAVASETKDGKEANDETSKIFLRKIAPQRFDSELREYLTKKGAII